MHNNLSSIRDLNEEIVRGLANAASKVIHSTGGTIKSTGTGIGNIFHGLLERINGTIK